VEQSEINVRSSYESRVRSCGPADFWIQVGRVNKDGPVDSNQIAMIADAIVKGLDLRPHDVLLDLCCGNGAVTDLIFSQCRGGIGVDFTPALIDVAKVNFERSPDRLYELADVREFVDTTDNADRFNKVMCYGSFPTLLAPKAAGVLKAFRRRFPNVQRVFIGNLPDLNRARLFFERDMRSELPSLQELRRHDTGVGTWRTEDEITKLAEECGWRANFSQMPASFYASYYRYDAILTVA
jgi:SAM-dependent methyltransferase